MKSCTIIAIILNFQGEVRVRALMFWRHSAVLMLVSLCLKCCECSVCPRPPPPLFCLFINVLKHVFKWGSVFVRVWFQFACLAVASPPSAWPLLHAINMLC